MGWLAAIAVSDSDRDVLSTFAILAGTIGELILWCRRASDSPIHKTEKAIAVPTTVLIRTNQNARTNSERLRGSLRSAGAADESPMIASAPTSVAGTNSASAIRSWSVDIPVSNTAATPLDLSNRGRLVGITPTTFTWTT